MSSPRSVTHADNARDTVTMARILYGEAPIQQDPGNLTDKEREQRGVRRFPTTSKEALDELERDEVLMNALGSGLATEYLKVRRAEAAAYAEQDEAFELDNHFFKY